MALAKCAECGHDVSTQAAGCPNCGAPPPVVVCYQAPGLLVTSATIAVRGKTYSVRDTKSVSYTAGPGWYCVALEMSSGHVPILNTSQREVAEAFHEAIKKALPEGGKGVANGAAKCPKCGSTQLTANKKGFGLGKAAVGGLLLGPVGLLGGLIGGGKVMITCLNCGHEWKPGDR